jgi:tRNA dimethylallyltransferase
MNKIIVLSGPTGIGKSDVGMKLCRMLANKAEIIVADSVQIRKAVSIGTNRPTNAERDEIPHHMVFHHLYNICIS